MKLKSHLYAAAKILYFPLYMQGINSALFDFPKFNFIQL